MADTTMPGLLGGEGDRLENSRCMGELTAVFVVGVEVEAAQSVQGK